VSGNIPPSAWQLLAVGQETSSKPGVPETTWMLPGVLLVKGAKSSPAVSPVEPTASHVMGPEHTTWAVVLADAPAVANVFVPTSVPSKRRMASSRSRASRDLLLTRLACLARSTVRAVRRCAGRLRVLMRYPPLCIQIENRSARRSQPEHFGFQSTWWDWSRPGREGEAAERNVSLGGPPASWIHVGVSHDEKSERYVQPDGFVVVSGEHRDGSRWPSIPIVAFAG